MEFTELDIDLVVQGRNNGKKLMAVRIVAHAFEIVRETTYRPNRAMLITHRST